MRHLSEYVEGYVSDSLALMPRMRGIPSSKRVRLLSPMWFKPLSELSIQTPRSRSLR